LKFSATAKPLFCHVNKGVYQVGAGGGTRTGSGDFPKIHHSAITTPPPKACNIRISTMGKMALPLPFGSFGFPQKIKQWKSPACHFGVIFP
jgi:hypothetical protein